MHLIIIYWALCKVIQKQTRQNTTLSFTELIDIDNCIMANLYDNFHINRKITCFLKWIFFEVDPGYMLPVEIQSNNCSRPVIGNLISSKSLLRWSQVKNIYWKLFNAHIEWGVMENACKITMTSQNAKN